MTELKEITVQVDTREKYPLLFPKFITVERRTRGKWISNRIKVIVEVVKLEDGDYRLKEFPHCCVVERKGSTRELIKNLYDAKDSLRTGYAFHRLMKNSQYPYLLIEVTPVQILREAKKWIDSPEGFLYRLSSIVTTYHLNTLWVSKPTSSSSRRALGESILHIMLSLGIQSEK